MPPKLNPIILLQELKRDLAKMTSSYEEMVDSNSVLSSEIERTKNLYHSSLIEGDDERARHKLTIQVIVWGQGACHFLLSDITFNSDC